MGWISNATGRFRRNGERSPDGRAQGSPAARLLWAAFLLLPLAACATPGAPQAPRWVSEPPSATQEFSYFVGSGSGAGGQESLAQRGAERSLVAEIARFVGEGLGAKSTPAQAEELARYEQRLGGQVGPEPGTQARDLEVVDRFVRKEGAKVTVFLLGRCSTAALKEELTRLRSGEGQEQAAAAPRASGAGSEVAASTPFEAAKAFIAAAAAAGASGGAGAGPQIERDLGRAREAIEGIKLEKLTGALSGLIRHPLPEAFKLRVMTSGGSPLPEAAIRASYTTAQPDGTLATAVEHLRSDESGMVLLELPPLSFVGPGTVTMALDLQGELASLGSLGAEYRPLAAQLDRAAQEKSVEFSYSATSQSAAIRTGVLIVDLDGSGNFIWGDATTSGVVEALAPLGFRLTTVPGNPSVAGIDDPDLLMIVRNNFGGQFTRVILGQAVISSFRQEAGGGYRVEVSGKLRVADLATGKVLATASRVAAGKGTNAMGAVTAAFRDLGARLGIEIANLLP